MLLTRSPLGHHPEEWASLDLHVLSTPPAFVLSQDQTLRRCLIPAENRDLTDLDQSTKGIPPHPTGMWTGYYLALTFGTLLSSQGADAHPFHPHGLPRWLVVHLVRPQRAAPAGASPLALPGRAARREKVTWLSDPCQTGSAVTPDTVPEPACHMAFTRRRCPFSGRRAPAAPPPPSACRAAGRAIPRAARRPRRGRRRRRSPARC